MKIRKPPTGPQGLPGPASSNTSPAARKIRKPTPIVQSVVKHPQVKRALRKPRVGPQGLPGPASSNTSPAAREASPGYRAYIVERLSREYKRHGLGGGSSGLDEPDRIHPDIPTSALEGVLARARDSKTTKEDAIRLALDTSSSEGLQAGPGAVVGKVLEQTVRPLHAIAGATDAALKGKNVPKAALRGLQNKDRTTFGKVLKDQGVPGWIAGPAGFVADVGLDPTTYLTGGTGSIARKEAMKTAAKAATTSAATKTTRKVTAKEATRAGSRTAGGGASAPALSERVMVRKTRTGDQRKGLVVKFAGKEVPGVRKATAKVVPRKLSGKVKASRVGRAGRHVASDLNPNVAGVDVSKEAAGELTRAARTRRAGEQRGRYAAQQRAIAIKKQVGEENYQRIIDAIEARNVGSLPPELRRVAVEIENLFTHGVKALRRAGVKVEAVGDLKKVPVPKVTARAADATAREVARAQRRVAAAERRVKAALELRAVSQGRAEVLSREVGGRAGEKAAERAGSVAGRTYDGAGRTGAPKDVLRYVDEVERSQRYAGGGHGVAMARAQHDLASAELRTAEKELARATGVHAAEKTARKVQTKAVRSAEKTNRKVVRSAKGYVPHQFTDDILEAEGRTEASRVAGGRVVKSTALKTRKDERALAEIRKDSPGVFSEDLPQLVADRVSEAASTTAKAKMNRRLTELGRKIPRDGSELKLGKGEAAYQIRGANIREITDLDELAKLTQPTRAAKGGGRLKPSYQAKGPGKELRGGQYVILNKAAVDRAMESAAGAVQGPGIVKGLDKAQGWFKTVATVPNPSFHVRNLIGDTQNAYLAATAGRPGQLTRNLGQAARALKHLGAREEALRDLTKRIDPSDAGLKIAGQHVTYNELIVMAEQSGAIRSGFIARELPELAQKNVTKGRDRLHRVSRQLQNREDVVRLATFIGGLKRGLSAEKAAERSAKYHFDYGHLTPFERNIARRAMPFYTFSARNIPLQIRTLFKKPGKFANYQKLREEAALLSGVEDQPQEVTDMYDKLEQAGVEMPDGWERYITGWEQKQAPIPVKIGGTTYSIAFGLPLTDLGLVPGDGKNTLDEFMQRAVGLATPIIKTPTELFANYNLFFRSPIESDTSPLVPAPTYVGVFPAAMQKRLGVVRGLNKKTGEAAWMWPGRVDYIAHVVPGPTNYAQRLAADSNRGGTGAEFATYAGVRTVKVDPINTVVGLAYERMSEIQTAQAKLRQQTRNGKPINADNPTAEYKKLADQFALLEEVVYGAKDARGDVVLPTAGAPRKIVTTKLSVPSSSGGSGISWPDEGPSSGGGVKWPDEGSSGDDGISWGDD